MPSVYIKTYGCQMNERDSEAVAAQPVAKGYSWPGRKPWRMSSCSTPAACGTRRNRKRWARCKPWPQTSVATGPMSSSVLWGCMAQSRGQELIDKLPDVDLVVGTQKFHRTAEYLDDIFGGRRDKVCDVQEEAGSEATIKDHVLFGKGRSKSVTAFVSIMQGCNQYCTFCIVPYTRGQERSRTIPDIVAEGHELTDRGVKEITLLGQIVTSYGKREIGTRDGKSAFVQLLEAMNEIDGLERIRFTSPHPKGYGDDLVETYGRLPKLCESAYSRCKAAATAF